MLDQVGVIVLESAFNIGLEADPVFVIFVPTVIEFTSDGVPCKFDQDGVIVELSALNVLLVELTVRLVPTFNDSAFAELPVELPNKLVAFTDLMFVDVGVTVVESTPIELLLESIDRLAPSVKALATPEELVLPKTVEDGNDCMFE